jgi:putative ABC transport system substrate-binding protein
MGLHAPDDYLRRLVSSTAVVAQAKTLGVEVGFMVVCDAKDIARLPAMIKASTDIGFAIPWQGLFPEHAKELIDALASMRRPAIYGRWFFSRQGGVLAMEPIVEPVDRRASIDMLLQVLEGQAPATLPVQLPRGFRIMVNAPAAARQGLQPSLSLLRRADNVVLK